MIKSLYDFYSSITELLNGIKAVDDLFMNNAGKTKRIKDLMKAFLDIPNFTIYKSRWDNTGKILGAREREEVIGKMNKIIREIPIS